MTPPAAIAATPVLAARVPPGTHHQRPPPAAAWAKRGKQPGRRQPRRQRPTSCRPQRPSSSAGQCCAGRRPAAVRSASTSRWRLQQGSRDRRVGAGRRRVLHKGELADPRQPMPTQRAGDENAPKEEAEDDRRRGEGNGYSEGGGGYASGHASAAAVTVVVSRVRKRRRRMTTAPHASTDGNRRPCSRPTCGGGLGEYLDNVADGRSGRGGRTLPRDRKGPAMWD